MWMRSVFNWHSTFFNSDTFVSIRNWNFTWIQPEIISVKFAYKRTNHHKFRNYVQCCVPVFIRIREYAPPSVLFISIFFFVAWNFFSLDIRIRRLWFNVFCVSEVSIYIFLVLNWFVRFSFECHFVSASVGMIMTRKSKKINLTCIKKNLRSRIKEKKLYDFHPIKIQWFDHIEFWNRLYFPFSARTHVAQYNAHIDLLFDEKKMRLDSSVWNDSHCSQMYIFALLETLFCGLSFCLLGWFWDRQKRGFGRFPFRGRRLCSFCAKRLKLCGKFYTDKCGDCTNFNLTFEIVVFHISTNLRWNSQC